MKRVITTVIISLLLTACAAMQQNRLNEAKANFERQNYSSAFLELEQLANSGSPQAQYAVGYMYYYGLGIARNTDTARSWIRKAADHQYLPARQALNLIMKNGQQHAPHNKTLIPGFYSENQKGDPDLNWMRAQNPHQYTIRLVSSANKKQVDKVAIKQAQNFSRLAEYRFMKNSKVWYGLVMGSYSNKADARKVLAKLPKNQQITAAIEQWQGIQSVMLP